MPRSVEITIIGAGTLATALAIAFRRRGHRITEIVSRNRPQSLLRARKLAKRVGARASTLREARFRAEVTWICVPDDAISEIAGQIAVRADWREKHAVHSSGALGSSQLAPLREAGASIASAHPLMTFVAVSPAQLEQVPFAVEGDRKALRIVNALIRSIGGTPFRIAPHLKPAYHLFGFFASPALVASLVVAEQVGELAGFTKRRSRILMEPIVRKTIDNFFASTPKQAFSGPLRRGDLETLRKHLEVLRARPQLLSFYKTLSAIACHELPVANLEAVKKLLS